MFSRILSGLVCVLCVVVVPTVWADYCNRYVDRHGYQHEAQQCNNFYCCGDCHNMQCCGDSRYRLTQSEQKKCYDSSGKGKGLGTILGSVLGTAFPVILCVGLIVCCMAPCCICYKKCRKGGNQGRPIRLPRPPSSPSGPHPSNPGFQPSNPGFQPSNPGYQPSNPGYQPSNPGFQPSNPGYQPSNPGFQPSNPGYPPPFPGYQPPNPNPAFQPSNPGYQPPFPGYQPSPGFGGPPGLPSYIASMLSAEPSAAQTESEPLNPLQPSSQSDAVPPPSDELAQPPYNPDYKPDQ